MKVCRVHERPCLDQRSTTDGRCDWDGLNAEGRRPQRDSMPQGCYLDVEMPRERRKERR